MKKNSCQNELRSEFFSFDKLWLSVIFISIERSLATDQRVNEILKRGKEEDFITVKPVMVDTLDFFEFIILNLEINF